MPHEPLTFLDMVQNILHIRPDENATIQAYDLSDLYAPHAPGTLPADDPLIRTADLRPPAAMVWYERLEGTGHSGPLIPEAPEFLGLTGALCFFVHPGQHVLEGELTRLVPGAHSELIAHLYRELPASFTEAVGHPFYVAAALHIGLDEHGRPYGEPHVTVSKTMHSLAGRNAEAYAHDLANAWKHWILMANRRLQRPHPRRELGPRRWALLEDHRHAHQSPQDTERRLRTHLKEADARHPGVFRWIFDHHVRHRQAPGADVTFIPVRAIIGHLAETAGRRHPDQISDAHTLSVLGSWRAGRGIYRVDETLLTALLDTEPLEQVPVELLRHLPEYAVYVPTPGVDLYPRLALAGFFAALDVTSGTPELNLLLDTHTQGLWSFTLPLTTGHIRDDLAPQMATTAHFETDVPPAFLVTVSACVNILLYLCSLNGQRDTQRGGTPDSPKRPVIKRVKSGERLFPAEQSTVWDVGIRMGSALRRAAAEQPQEPPSGRPGGTPKRPHVRRAHWHTYRTGPRNTEQASEARRMPPMAIKFNLDNHDTDDLPMVVRDVEA